MPPKPQRKTKADASSVDSEAACSERPLIDGISVTVDKKKRVNCVIKFSSKCVCGNHQLVTSASYNSLIQFDDPAIEMMERTIETIKRHGKKRISDGDTKCDLEVEKFDFAMRNDLIWRGLWANVTSQVLQAEKAARDRSDLQAKKHEEKAAAVAKKPWEEGVEFKNRKAKSDALIATMDIIQQRTGKSITRAKELLTSVATKLNTQIDGFDSKFVFEEKKQQKAMDFMFDRARTCIKSLTSNTNNNAQLLTGVAALFLPGTNDKQSESMRTCCEQLGLNRKAEYTRKGRENRERHDEYVSLKGEELKVGEMVTVRGGGCGEIHEMTSESITIHLLPWSSETTYKPASKARARRLEPRLDEYERERRSDTTPIDWINTIDAFHREHNATSPNKKDIAILRHPQFPRQQKSAPRIYRYETWDELWGTFQTEHAHIAEKVMNPKYPNECPMILRTHAPWEMTKGTNSSCLCINCEGTNAAKRGARAAVNFMSTIIEEIEDGINDGDNDTVMEDASIIIDDGDNSISNDDDDAINNDDDDDDAEVDAEDDAEDDAAALSSEEQSTLNKINRVIEIMQQPYKYDMCMKCICPPETGKLEDAKFSCVEGSCPSCGMDKLWSNGVRKKILTTTYDSDTSEFVYSLNKNCRFASDEWLNEVEWRTYVYKEKPTVATHAREVRRQAAAARPPGEDDLDYSPTEGTTARNLVLETQRGTIIDYLDHLEKQLEKHIIHRNLVCSEHRSKLQYERNSRPLSCLREIDFSENGGMDNFDQVQSEYWDSEQYTLMMAIISFLQVDAWNKTKGLLEEGDEVTVNGELAGEPIDKESFWAVVKKYSKDGDNETVTVEDADGKLHTLPRSLLRLRTRHTICIGLVG
eukprot:scaffold13403_cov120-Skeletonema_dohrnii-CCMP3373.AAC.1